MSSALSIMSENDSHYRTAAVRSENAIDKAINAAGSAKHGTITVSDAQIWLKSEASTLHNVGAIAGQYTRVLSGFPLLSCDHNKSKLTTYELLIQSRSVSKFAKLIDGYPI